MKKPFPVWIAAVLPATLAGHALAYALAGEAAADGRHAYLAPTLAVSAGLLSMIVVTLLGGVLLRAGWVAVPKGETSILNLWARLAPAQIVLFAALERAEGYAPSLLGCGCQTAVALATAAALAAFALLLRRCERGAAEASRYLERLLGKPADRYVRRAAGRYALALCTAAGTRRFQRPPPRP